jgi:hypothetical protein
VIKIANFYCLSAINRVAIVQLASAGSQIPHVVFIQGFLPEGFANLSQRSIYLVETCSTCFSVIGGHSTQHFLVGVLFFQTTPAF